MGADGPATIVLVHGAWAGAWCWKLLGEELDRRAAAHRAVDLPSVGERPDPSIGVHEDAAAVRRVLDNVSGPVVLVGNSYGGVVITEAAAPHPAVRRLVYISAFMPRSDEVILPHLLAHCGEEFLAGVTFGEGGLTELDPDVALRTVYPQAPPEVGEWAAAMGRPMAGGEAETTVRAAAWEELPSTYLVCGEDRAVLPEHQRQWATTRATDSLERPYDHCPQVSHPAEVADLLADLAT